MSASLDVIKGYLAKGKNPEGEASDEKAEGQTAAETTESPKSNNLSFEAPAQKSASQAKFNFKSPGSLALLLLFILFLVFAIAPAYEGSTKTRLQTILAAIVKGGTFRGVGSTASVTSYTGTPDNGAITQEYNFVPVFPNGAGVVQA